MKRAYLAGPWAHRQIVRDARKILQSTGIDVQARWIDWPDGESDPVDEASADLDDILDADVFVLLNYEGLPPSTGRAIETGFALAHRIPVILVGKRSSPFHHLQRVTVVESVHDVANVLRGGSAS